MEKGEEEEEEEGVVVAEAVEGGIVTENTVGREMVVWNLYNEPQTVESCDQETESGDWR